jgi:hypothetical protein
MKPKIPPKLGRLLGDYERLTRDEGAALRSEDFARLAEIHAFKPTLLLAIIEEGESLGLDRRVLWFDDCLVALAALERDNLEYAARGVVQLTAQQACLEAARMRLRSLGHAYRRTENLNSRIFNRS